MDKSQVPRSERTYIGFFGKRNAGKSSLVNAVTNQALSVVSETLGTTTDPVLKSMELLPLGPVVVIDTPGFDDEGELGALRMKKTKEMLNRCDIAVLVAESGAPLADCDKTLISLFVQKEIPYLIAYNKTDIHKPDNVKDGILVSAQTGEGIENLKKAIANFVKTDTAKKRIVGDLLSPKDLVVLVTPIDEAAPKGRLILPQQQTIRDILESNACALVVKETELKDAFAYFKQPPKLVITDSQAFSFVSQVVPKEIPLTSFSILMARYKGYLKGAANAVSAIEQLKDGDRILIAEGCTHHRQCNDIGTVKIPGWLKRYTEKEIIIDTVSGTEFPEDLSPYRLVIHCGGCMLNEREVHFRAKTAEEQGVPMTNYGLMIAYMKGIFKRATEMLPELE